MPRPPVAADPGDAAAADADAAIEQRVEAVLGELRRRGGRVTTSRRLLVRFLLTDAAHRTAEDLFAAVQALAPDVHLSTIYRNLEELERIGFVVHTHLGHGPATYHLASESHGHLVCEACGAVFEVPSDYFAALARSAERQYGFTIDPRHFAVLGRCPRCSELTPGVASTIR